MNINRMKINHLTNPLGYELTNPQVSFCVTDTAAAGPEAIQVQVAADAAFSRIVYDTGRREDLSMLAIPLNMDLQPCTRYYWKAQVWADNGETCESETAWFETAKQDAPWQGKWIGCSALGKVAPVFSKTFETAAIAEGRIYAIGLGMYELYLDGEKVGNEFLAPGCTDYNRWMQYQTYAVTVKPGVHKLEAVLCDGWYLGRFGLD